MKILTAKWVLPIKSPPIESGAVVIESGRIVWAGPQSELAKVVPDAESRAEVCNFQNAAILPGLVNAHSHLELTALRNRLDSFDGDFRTWLITLNTLRAGMTEDELIESALLGAREAASFGVTLLGDVARFGNAAAKAIEASGLRAIVFQETEFSPDNRTADDDFRTLAEKFENYARDFGDKVNFGISPHTPYTVSSRLFELIAGYAILNRIKLAIHTAEGRSENELLKHGRGFFMEVFEKFGVEWHPPGLSAVRYLERLGVLAAKPLLIHCVDLEREELQTISQYGATIAHCPKSNAKFGHGAAPLSEMMEESIAIGIGTDSAASNNFCDVLDEARFAALLARSRNSSAGVVSPKEILRLATLGGAEALGLSDSVGSIEEGKLADLAVFGLDGLHQTPLGDIEAALAFSTRGSDCIATFVGGNEVYRKQLQ
ncbi:MAG TPA: amidohydrolase family protein [Pyrinomonadaceae bacterium]|nr:amidohydrolase family protein [Pyrinomonadaceae bacterium]